MAELASVSSLLAGYEPNQAIVAGSIPPWSTCSAVFWRFESVYESRFTSEKMVVDSSLRFSVSSPILDVTTIQIVVIVGGA